MCPGREHHTKLQTIWDVSPKGNTPRKRQDYKRVRPESQTQRWAASFVLGYCAFSDKQREEVDRRTHIGAEVTEERSLIWDLIMVGGNERWEVAQWASILFLRRARCSHRAPRPAPRAFRRRCCFTGVSSEAQKSQQQDTQTLETTAFIGMQTRITKCVH